MATVNFITSTGEQIVVENAVGTLMEIALENNVLGIEGACGGVCSCATCHVTVSPPWIGKVGRAGGSEQDVLSYEDGTDANSRLSCQIEMRDELDGLIVTVVPL